MKLTFDYKLLGFFWYFFVVHSGIETPLFFVSNFTQLKLFEDDDHHPPRYPYLIIKCQSLGCKFQLSTTNVLFNEPCTFCNSRRTLQKTLVQCPIYGETADDPLEQSYTRLFYLDPLKRTWQNSFD